MDICQDTKDSLKNFTFAPIKGQPTNEDINKLVEECTNAASSVLVTIGRGQHRHIGMIFDEADYIVFLQ